MSNMKANGPGAAATALRAEIVASSKPTRSDNPNPEGQQSAIASAKPDETASKQTRDRMEVGRLSLRAAVNAKCKSCIYDADGGNGTWREQVQACASANCPLHAVRPITVKGQKRDAEARHDASDVFGRASSEPPLQTDGLQRNGQIADQRRAA